MIKIASILFKIGLVIAMSGFFFTAFSGIGFIPTFGWFLALAVSAGLFYFTASLEFKQAQLDSEIESAKKANRGRQNLRLKGLYKRRMTKR